MVSVPIDDSSLSGVATPGAMGVAILYVCAETVATAIVARNTVKNRKHAVFILCFPLMLPRTANRDGPESIEPSPSPSTSAQQHQGPPVMAPALHPAFSGNDDVDARGQGTIPHSNILFTTGPAILLKNASRICGSVLRKPTTRCSSGDCCLPRFCHSCSQVDDWYFWITFSATRSRIGNCCAYATPTATQPATATTSQNCLLMTNSFTKWFQFPFRCAPGSATSKPHRDASDHMLASRSGPWWASESRRRRCSGRRSP